MARPREPRIRSLETHPRPYVSICVAAEYLQLHEQTVRARIDVGLLMAYRDGRTWRIPIAALQEYERARNVPYATR
jgi:excisionase family DNA binding protein